MLVFMYLSCIYHVTHVFIMQLVSGDADEEDDDFAPPPNQQQHVPVRILKLYAW